MTIVLTCDKELSAQLLFHPTEQHHATRDRRQTTSGTNSLHRINPMQFTSKFDETMSSSSSSKASDSVHTEVTPTSLPVSSPLRYPVRMEVDPPTFASSTTVSEQEVSSKSPSSRQSTAAGLTIPSDTKSSLPADPNYRVEEIPVAKPQHRLIKPKRSCLKSSCDNAHQASRESTTDPKQSTGRQVKFSKTESSIEVPRWNKKNPDYEEHMTRRKREAAEEKHRKKEKSKEEQRKAEIEASVKTDSTINHTPKEITHASSEETPHKREAKASKEKHHKADVKAPVDQDSAAQHTSEETSRKRAMLLPTVAEAHVRSVGESVRLFPTIAEVVPHFQHGVPHRQVTYPVIPHRQVTYPVIPHRQVTYPVIPHRPVTYPVISGIPQVSDNAHHRRDPKSQPTDNETMNQLYAQLRDIHIENTRGRRAHRREPGPHPDRAETVREVEEHFRRKPSNT